MTTSHQSIDTQDLSEYVQALKDYKNTGYKQSTSIIQTLKESELTPAQLNQIFPGAWLQTIQKIDPQDEDEQKLKNNMIDLLEGLNRRFREQTNNNLSKMKEQSKEKVYGKKTTSDSEKENISQNQMNTTEQQSSDLKQKSESEEQKHPPVSEDMKNFTVQSFATELVTDYKTDPAAKKDMKPIAVEKAKQLEEAVEAIVEGDEDKFRMEARNVSSFLATKHNEELRQGILSGEIDPKEFVGNKEEFLSSEIKSKFNEKEKQALNDGNLNRDVEIVRDSALYTCEKCGSKKVEKTEKQMGSASHSSNSVLFCAECDHVEVKEA